MRSAVKPNWVMLRVSASVSGVARISLTAASAWIPATFGARLEYQKARSPSRRYSRASWLISVSGAISPVPVRRSATMRKTFR